MMLNYKEDELDRILVALSKKLHDGGINHAEAKQAIQTLFTQAYSSREAEIERKLQVKHAAEMSVLDQEIMSLKAHLHNLNTGEDK